MTKRLSKTSLLLLSLSGVVLIGFALLVSSQVFSFAGFAFEIVAYGLSVIALVLAILSVLNSIRQNRIMNRMVRDVHAAVLGLKEVADSNVAIEEMIEEEIEEENRMNKAITEVLAEHGVGASEKVRKLIAKKVSHRLKKKPKKL
jgi:hypothetical protein